MKRDAAIEALQSLQGPDGWHPSPYVTLDDDRRLWERRDGARGLVGHVAVRALGGNRVGWYRVRGTAIGGRGSEMVATVDGARVEGAFRAVCGWVEVVAGTTP